MAAAYLTPPSPRRRAIAGLLTLAVHALLLLLLLRLGPREFVPMAQGDALATFDVAPDPARQPRRAERRTPQTPAPRPRAEQPKPKVEIAFKDTSGVIWMSRDQFARTDIARSGSLPPRGAAGAVLADAGGAADGDSATAGTGPGGQTLYAAEWYREPTSAELRTFLPSAQAGSWGRIACRMVPEYRVEDCQTVGESPLGSGIATGMRRASWQFRVRPPRVNGEPRYGTWVMIVIRFGARGPQARR